VGRVRTQLEGSLPLSWLGCPLAHLLTAPSLSRAVLTLLTSLDVILALLSAFMAA